MSSSLQSFQLPHRRLFRLVGAAFFGLGALGSLTKLPAETNEPLATAGWEKFSIPADDLFLQPEAQQRARALALFSKGLRQERNLAKESALASYQEAMALDSHNVRLASRMANLLAGIGKFNEALALLERTKAENLEQSEAWLELSRYCLRQHHGSREIKAKALQYAKQALDAFPDRADSYNHLLKTYFDLSELADGDPRAKAREVLARAEQVPSESAEFWMALVPSARQAYPLDDAENRAANLEVILRFASKAEKFAGPDEIMAERLALFFHEYATRLKSLALAKRALFWFEQLTQRHPENLAARRTHATLLRQLGEEARATKIWQELVQINPQDLGSHRALVKVAEAHQDHPALIRHRSELLRWEGGTVPEWLEVSEAMVKESQLEPAVSLLKRAQVAHPAAAELGAQLARIYLLRNQAFEGFNAFQSALTLAEMFPDKKGHAGNAKLLTSSGFYVLGATLAGQQPNRTELATHWYRKALEVAKPETPALTAQCYHGLASLWLERDEQLEEAGELLRTANSLVPEHPDYLDGLGWFYFKQHNYEESLPLLKKAAALAKGSTARILHHLAQCLEQLRRPLDAIPYAEQAAAHPQATPAMKQHLAELKAAK